MRRIQSWRNSILACCLVVLGGCATYPAGHPINDPWENYNRAMYKFNDTVDRYALKPVAKGYRFITPNFIEKGISNFFSNIDDVTVTINDLLQGKFAQAAQDGWRFLLNSTIGLGGLFDVATPLGLEKHHEDFGQTLGKWGVAEGPYIVLPFLGPATVRSGGGRIVDFASDPLTYVSPDWARLSLVGGEMVNQRAALLEASALLDSAFDPYVFLRDAYVQNRRQLAYDNRFTEADIEENTGDTENQENSIENDLLDELDSLDDAEASDVLDELDELDALDMLDNEAAEPPKDELDLLDELEARDSPAQ